MRRHWGLFLLLGLLLVACTQSPVTPLPTNIEASELAPFFDDHEGTFVVFDVQNNQTIRYNPQRAGERFSPFSTFKIPGALIGLESGVIKDAEHVIVYDPDRYPLDFLPTIEPFSEWTRDHTLRSAIQYSVVWYFRELVKGVGEEEMARLVAAAEYGNTDISSAPDSFWLSTDIPSGLDSFWLAGSLEISADEQVGFLYRLYTGELPFSERSQEIVREIIILEDTPTYRISGKTGTGPSPGGQEIGWLVGYVEKGEDAYIFALLLEGEDIGNQSARLALVKELLSTLEILP